VIHGIGTDIVEVARIRAALERHGQRFAERILGADERAEYAASRDGTRFLAKRFAAKEAFAKALGTGISPPATLQAVMVGHDPAGRPVYRYDARLAAHLAGQGLSAHLSLSDEADYVVAFALIERS
jgi:holo-[acyl-carrier protein] synthase